MENHQINLMPKTQFKVCVAIYVELMYTKYFNRTLTVVDIAMYMHG